MIEFEVVFQRVTVADLRPGELFYLGKIMMPCTVLTVNSRSVLCQHSYDNYIRFSLDATASVYVRKTMISKNLKLPL